MIGIATYQFVFETLKNEIVGGKYGASSAFPSSTALARRFKTSRATIRRALIAVRGTDGLFNVHRGAYRMVGDQGENEWVPDEENGPHLRVTEKVNKNEVGRIVDGLIGRRPRFP